MNILKLIMLSLIMFFAIENEEEFIKNISCNENSRMELKLSYMVDKKSNMLDFLPIINDLRDIILSYYTNEVTITCFCYYVCDNNQYSYKRLQIVFVDSEYIYDADGYVSYGGSYKQYKNEIDAICTIANTVFNL